MGAGAPGADAATTAVGVRRRDEATGVADVVRLDPRPDEAAFDAPLDEAARAPELAHGPH